MATTKTESPKPRKSRAPKAEAPAPAPTRPRKVVSNPTTAATQDGVEVHRLASRKGLEIGRPKQAHVMKTAYSAGLSGSYGVSSASAGNFYSPELSTDFLELPQGVQEEWAYYRFFARKNPYVKQAINLNTELPLSRIRINTPKARNRDLAMQATRFIEQWARRVSLLRRLLSIVREWNVIGVAHIWCEDTNPAFPPELFFDEVPIVDDKGARVELRPKAEVSAEALKWLRRNYKGWTDIKTLPPEQVHRETFSFSREVLVDLIPGTKDRRIVADADSGDARAQRVVSGMDPVVVDAIRAGSNIPLNTDPEAGSFIYSMDKDRSDYEAHGHSLLESVLQTLVHFDKLRQAQASIASRHMTPIRIVWAEDMDEMDTDNLRAMVDLALQDPDFSIVTNFEVHWEEMGSDQRLLDLSNEREAMLRDLCAGTGVTEGLMTGESAYGGDRISLEVINTRFMHVREQLQDFVEEYLFRPMCKRMGFIEFDEDGIEEVLVPRLSFTRLALRDNQDTFDALFNLYQKGSLDIDTILELLNIDPVMTREKLERDIGTVNDSSFNEVLRGLYGEVGRKLAEESDAVQKSAQYLKLKYTPPATQEGRF